MTEKHFRRMAAMLALALLVSASPAALAQSAVVDNGSAPQRRLNLREPPDKGSASLGRFYSGTPVEIVASILACSWSYAAVGQTLAKRPGALEHPFYGEWIQSYAGEEYAACNQALIDLMNRLAADAPQEQLDVLKEIFVNCSRYELGFWTMAWDMRV